jgi:hypothetical protein
MQDDPLKILREDTYSNEQTNEMVGDMIRKQHLKRSEWCRFPMKDEIHFFQLRNGGCIELNGRTQKAYNFTTGDILFTFQGMSEDEFLKILANYNKE